MSTRAARGTVRLQPNCPSIYYSDGISRCGGEDKIFGPGKGIRRRKKSPPPLRSGPFLLLPRLPLRRGALSPQLLVLCPEPLDLVCRVDQHPVHVQIFPEYQSQPPEINLENILDVFDKKTPFSSPQQSAMDLPIFLPKKIDMTPYYIFGRKV